jgi:2-methylisocitrate lyase-like PEP mutase family enzyme
MVAKIRSALDARQDDDLVIVARTDANAVEGIDSALRRAEAYQKAGADAIFVEGPRTQDEARRIAQSLDVPLVYNVTPTGSVPGLDAAALEEMGFKMLSCSVYVLLAAIPALQQFLRTFRQTGDARKAGAQGASMKEYLDILGFPEWQKLEDLYLGDKG